MSELRSAVCGGIGVQMGTFEMMMSFECFVMCGNERAMESSDRTIE